MNPDPDTRSPLSRAPAFREQGEFPLHNPNPVLKFSPSGELLWFNLAASDAANDAGLESPALFLGSGKMKLIARTIANPEVVFTSDNIVGDRSWRWSFVIEPQDSHIYCYGQDVTDLIQCKLQLIENNSGDSSVAGSGMFRAAVKRLDDAARYADLDPEVIERLKIPKAILSVSIPIRMDDGELRVFEGYRVHHSDLRGPGKGDIPAPDIYTNPRIMGWMMDEYSRLAGKRTLAVITGKPLGLGGSLGRDTATGRGGYVCIKELEQEAQWKPAEKTVAIQGFGNAGQAIARLLHADGYRIVAVSDSRGGIHRAEGLDIPSLIQQKNGTNKLEAVYCDGSVCEAVEAEPISNAELLELDVDILVPAALENVITETNASNIRARIILELANGPLNDAADRILAEQGITVIPDILANAGGVTVSYYEWVQNRSGESWSEARVHEKLDARMKCQFHEILSLAGENEITLRTAAYALALRRINQTVEALGTSRYYNKR